MAIEQWLVEGQKTIDIERIRRVDAHLIGGSIAILAHDQPQARVEVASTTVRDLKIAVDGDTLVIDHPQVSLGDLAQSAKTLWGRPRAEISLLVPQDCDIAVRAASAEVLVVGVHGEITLNSAAGEQFVDGTSGSLHLHTVDAEVSVRDHTGTVATKTVAGDVTVAGAVSAFSGNTVSGNTVLDITSGLPDRVSNRAVAGTTTIRIPAEVTPDYRVSTVTAKAHLQGEDEQPVPGQTFSSPAREYAKRLTEVHLRSVAGRITVVRAGDEGDLAGSATSDTTDARVDGRVGGPAGSAVTTRKVFRRIVKDRFDERIDERVEAASDQLGVEPGEAPGSNLGDAAGAADSATPAPGEPAAAEPTQAESTPAPDAPAAGDATADDGETEARS